MTVRVLATGDIHIGKRPTRVRDAAMEQRASTARMWEAIAQRAIDEEVDAVLLSGDVLEHDKIVYEAIGPLGRGFRALAEAGIACYAVSGNHDWQVFPKLVDELDTPDFHLIGRGGKWEETYLERDGQKLLRIVGWSYPARIVPDSPLDTYDLAANDGLPTVGLLHADLNASGSKYAPVALSELQRSDVTLWLLGHIHKPQHEVCEARADVLYPGSPQALDPGESGVHGPWLLEFDGPQSVSCRQLPMSRVVYEECEIDLSSAVEEEDFLSAINDTVNEQLSWANSLETPPELLSLRLTLVGATPLCSRINHLVESQGLRDLDSSIGDVQVSIDKVTNATRPAVNLEQLATQNDPAGTLARTLGILERDDNDKAVDALISDAITRMSTVRRASAYRALPGDDEPDRTRARQLLLEQGWQLLETLLAQKPSHEEVSA